MIRHESFQFSLKIKSFVFIIFLVMMFWSNAFAFDTEISQKTLSGLRGFYILVEDLNSNITKYSNAQRVPLSKEQIKKDVEHRLKGAAIKVLSWDEMLKRPGKPMLYVNINTHEYEKFWYAYDIRIEAQQVVTLEHNPLIKMSACTWSMNMTGVVNIGTMNKIRDNLNILLDRFVAAYTAVNGKK
jgi:hypothetical protein